MSQEPTGMIDTAVRAKQNHNGRESSPDNENEYGVDKQLQEHLRDWRHWDPQEAR